MMTLPSSSQLIDVMRTELATALKEVGDNPKVRNCLGMVDTLLASIAVRSEREIGWMIEEIGEIEAIAGKLVAMGLDRDERLRAELDGLAAQTAQTFDTAAVREHYHAASALLADCIELALTAGGEARQEIERAISTRLEHEARIRGALTLVGRG